MAASVVSCTAGALQSDQPPLTPQAEKRAAELAWAAESDHATASIRPRFRYGAGESMARAMSGVR